MSILVVQVMCTSDTSRMVSSTAAARSFNETVQLLRAMASRFAKAGPGALALASGDVFVGLFDAHGLYDGPQCVLTLANGDRYQGGFAKGAKHGTGKMKYSASGDFYEGQWRKGVKVKL